LKEEQFLRYLLATGALAFLLAGSNAFALADPAANTPQTSAAQAAAPVTVTAPAAIKAAEAGEPAESPDVVEWTAQLIREESKRSTPPHKSVAHGLGKFASRILSRTTTIARNLTRDALRFLGTPYVFGGTTSSGFDCSAYVQHVFAMIGISLPRTADAQYYAGRRIKGGMKVGDLVFFQTYEPGPSHVGIYIGHGKFVHASSSHGVMVSDLSNSYWQARYLGAKRYIATR
jgi:cell wall-associated NlpC family hydrolase